VQKLLNWERGSENEERRKCVWEGKFDVEKAISSKKYDIIVFDILRIKDGEE